MSRTATAPRFRGGGVIEYRSHGYREPGPGEILVAVGANAICGTDRHAYAQGSPVVPGHESAGVVIAVGEHTTVAVGTRGVVYLMDFCGDCRSCRLGATNQCTAKRGDFGLTTDGGYGPYGITHESCFFAVDDGTSLVEATMLLDVMGTSGHAWRRAGLVRPDLGCAYVAGAGPIGLGLVLMAKIIFGPDFPVAVSDLNRWRLDHAASFGAVPLLADDTAALRRFAPDVAFDSTGRTAARTAALTATSQRGGLVCVGHGESVTLDVSADLIAPERALLGSEYFRFDELAENLARLQQHRDLVRRVITHTIGANEVPKGFELFLGGETGKVVVVHDGVR